MSYLAPSEFVTKMVDAGESKVFMATRDTLIRAYMAGAILALAAVFAVAVTQQTGYPIIGAILFPVGFCMLYLLGFDLLTGVFVLSPLALIDKRPGVTLGGVLKNWGLVFMGNLAGAVTVAFMMAIVFTFGFSQEPNAVGKVISGIGEARTLGYKDHGAAGMLTLFIRGVLCNWMVSTGVVGAMISTSVSGKVIAMWMPIMVFFAMTFEHSVVLLAGSDFGPVQSAPQRRFVQNDAIDGTMRWLHHVPQAPKVLQLQVQQLLRDTKLVSVGPEQGAPKAVSKSYERLDIGDVSGFGDGRYVLGQQLLLYKGKHARAKGVHIAMLARDIRPIKVCSLH